MPFWNDSLLQQQCPPCPTLLWTSALPMTRLSPAQADYQARYLPWIDQVEAALNQAFEKAWQQDLQRWGSNLPAAQLQRLYQALRHATLLGGKRFRPVLVWETGQMLRVPEATLLPVACAVELIHAQSLVFDDLPCMDNDALRRGQSTVHVAFDEATAVLVGDALACFSFGLLAQAAENPAIQPVVAPAVWLKLVGQLSAVASLGGLVNGQYLDMVAQANSATPQLWHYIHLNKTGALIRYCLQAPGLLAGLPSGLQQRLVLAGEQLGTLFQLVDDLLDVEGSATQLGKTPGKDAQQNKASAVVLAGPMAVKLQVDRLYRELGDTLRTFRQAGYAADGLLFLVDYCRWRLR